MNINRRSLYSWVLYDFGSSAFSAMIQTFIFAAYFTESVAENNIVGGSEWGAINSFSALVIGILAPIIGAIADQGGKRKVWLAVLTAIAIVSTALLWFVKPDPSYVPLGLMLVSLGIIGTELATVFYNAMLPSLVPEESVGKWSGLGWAFGYAGGMGSLITAILFFSEARGTFLLCAGWYLIFTIPLFIWTKGQKGKEKRIKEAVQDGLKELFQTFQKIRKYREIAKFLAARIFYIDGLINLFAFGGVYAASQYGLKTHEILIFGIILNVTAGLGAFAFSWFDDIIGPKKVILISLAGLCVPILVLLTNNSLTFFWIFGSMLGFFVGPVQSSSRSLMARMAPVHLRNEMFGFFAFSGKGASFLGPLLISWAIYTLQSQKAALMIILLFFVIGGSILTRVDTSKTS